MPARASAAPEPTLSLPVDVPMEYRPIPVVALNDKLDADSLATFCRELLAQGYGGYVLSSRTGLKTEFLSEAWFQALRGPLDVAQEAGVPAWICDDDRWPSGGLGGELARAQEAFRPRVLCVESVKAEDLLSVLADRSTLATYQLKLNERYEAVEPALIGRQNIPDRGVAWRFFTVTQKDHPRFNNSAYIDTLNPKAVQAFVDAAYAPYLEQLKKELGKTVPGFLTNQPQMPHSRMPGFDDIGGVPWTPNFPQFFKNRAGYDLMKVLPYLFFKGPNYQKVRYDFWRLLAQRFIECFTQCVAKYCEKSKIALTGNFTGDESIVQQVVTVGSVMPHQWLLPIPGVEHARRTIDRPVAFKQATSVAAQSGKKRVKGELFGVAGQDLTFAEQKWIADYHLVMGVNTLVPRVSLFSFAGERRRDHPPTFSPHQPWWSFQKPINDYMARAAWFCSQGEYHASTLVLHPVSSGWALWQPKVRQVGRGFLDFENTELAQVDENLDRLVRALCGAQREFDLGDETLLEQHGSIAKNGLKLGEMTYNIVIMPPGHNWSSATISLLTKFAAKGGRILIVGSIPTLLDGRPAEDKWDKFSKTPGVNRTGASTGLLLMYINRLEQSAIAVLDSDGKPIDDIWSRRCVDVDGRQWVFLANRSREKEYQATVQARGTFGVMHYDLMTGQSDLRLATLGDDVTKVVHTFAACGSLALVFDPALAEAHLPPEQPLQAKPIKRLRSPWQFTRSAANALVLDFCKFRMANGRYAKPSPVWKARNAIREFAGFGPYVGVQPWVVRKYATDGVKPIGYSMLFEFENRLTKKAQVALVLESADLMQVKVNEKPVTTKNAEHHWDPRFFKTDITNMLVKGLNTVELIADFNPDIEIEDIYILGDFCTKRLSNTSYAIVDEPTTIKDGDWVKQGYHFFAGNMTYHKVTELKVPKQGKVLVKLRDPAGTGFRVHMNGEHVADLFSPPWTADVTSAVKRGKNKISIEVLGTLRNTFGPLHNAAGTPDYWWGPQAFVDEKNWSDSYLFVQMGLLDGAEVLETGE